MKKGLFLFFSLSFLIISNPLFGRSFPSPLKPINTSIENATIVNIIYKNGVFSIKGLTGIGNVKIYSIIGNEVASFNQVNLFDFQRNLRLDLKTMYIVRIETQGEIKLYKFVAR